MASATLVEARARTANLSASLPAAVTVAELAIREKAPFFALCIREATIWRVEEIARNACDALGRGDLAAGTILIRSLTESAAMMWRLRQLIEKRSQIAPEEMHETISKMWVGWKGDPDFPQAINVMTYLKHLDREVPGVLDSYEKLSEYAHPNWSGLARLFSKTDYKAHVTQFGRGLDTGKTPQVAVTLLCGALGVFEAAYNASAPLIEQWIHELREKE